MNTLADRVILSKSGVTRLIDRLVADGLVVRDQCVTDARGAEAVLTDKGLERLRRGVADPPARHRAPLLRGRRRRRDLGAIRRAMVDVAEHAEQDPRPTVEPAAAG